MNKLVMIVDDEEDIIELVSLNLAKNGFKVKGFSDASEFFKNINKELPDLIILDLMLPDLDGFEICKQLKKDKRYSSIPVIMLTAKSDETDKVLGLELGADDYITKPFSPRELAARVKVALRKNVNNNSVDNHQSSGLVIDVDQYTVKYEGQKIDLTSTEFNILKLLASKRGNVFPRDKILDMLWGEDKYVLDRTIDVHIKNLREKLGAAGNLIKNIRGVGYKLEE